MNKESSTAPRALLFGSYYLAKKKKESLGTSVAVQVTRKESKKLLSESANAPLSHKESGKMNVNGRFIENLTPGTASPGRRFRVVLLQEGLGNLEDCFYYTAKAIESAVPVFEGAQFYVNHPAQSDEIDRPERDVRDIAGYFENLSKQISKDGRAQLAGDLVLLEGDAFDRERQLMVESIQYAQKHQGRDLVGLSINASGDFEEANITNFMQSGMIPPGAMPKLEEALQRGIVTIRPVQEMTSAVSCDLVTVAGAGGRINQLLEKEKSMEDKDKKEAGHHEDESDKKAKEAGEEKPATADGQTGEKPDADSDEELIKGLMKKYMGDGFSDDDHSMAKEAYENAKELHPDDHNEAMKCAGHNMKMAKHMQKKSAGAQAPQPPQGDQPQEVGVDGVVAVHSPDPVKGSHPGPKDVKKESAKPSDKLITLTAENAKLKAQLEEINLDKFIDKTLRESKLPMAATKKFRECIKGVKTEKEINDKLVLFKEAYTAGSESEGFGYVLGAEKNADVSGESTKDYADCVEE